MDAKTAAMIATQAHAGQRYGNEDYVQAHVMEVVNRVLRDPRHKDDAVVVAWLHDVLEDTRVTMDELVAQGLTHAQQGALFALTRQPEEKYGLYLTRICEVPLAVMVKYHDLCANIANKPPARLEQKYQLAFHRIAEVFDRMSGVVDCSSCGRAIVFLKTSTGSKMPVDRTSLPAVFSRTDEYNAKAGHISHFATCSNADKHRRRKA